MASYQLYLYLATHVTLYAVTSLRHDVLPKYDSSIDINKTPSVHFPLLKMFILIKLCHAFGVKTVTFKRSLHCA